MALLVAAIVASGPGAAGHTTEVDAKLMTSKKRMPKHVFRSIGRLALTKEAYERLWERFRLRRDRPPVSFERRAVLFAGTGESGSCPLRYRALALAKHRTTFRIKLKPAQHEVCTADWTPRAMVISLPGAEVPRGRLHARFGEQERFRVNRVRQ